MPHPTALKELTSEILFPDVKDQTPNLKEAVPPISPWKLFESLSQFGSTYFPSSPNLESQLAELAAKGGIKQSQLTLTSCIRRDCRGQNTPLFLALLDETGFLSPDEQPLDNAIEQFDRRNDSGPTEFVIDLKHPKLDLYTRLSSCTNRHSICSAQFSDYQPV